MASCDLDIKTIHFQDIENICETYKIQILCIQRNTLCALLFFGCGLVSLSMLGVALQSASLAPWGNRGIALYSWNNLEEH